jgi:hypothetical protein
MRDIRWLLSAALIIRALSNLLIHIWNLYAEPAYMPSILYEIWPNYCATQHACRMRRGRC